MSLELMGKPDNKVWVHQAKTKMQGMPKADFDGFLKRLKMAMVKVDVSKSGAIAGLAAASTLVLAAALF